MNQGRDRILSRLTIFALTLALMPTVPGGTSARAGSVDFGDLSLATGSFNNGSDDAGGFASGGAFFNNTYGHTYDTWAGWSYSNVTDNTTAGYTNQYSAITGGGYGGSSIYGVAFASAPGDAYINLPDTSRVESMVVTNTTYAYLSMKMGDSFVSAFKAGDWYRLTVTGYSDLDAQGTEVGSLTIDLADFTNGRSFLLNSWESVDLASLGDARSLGFTFDSSQHYMVGSLDLGSVVPSYVALGALNFASTAAVPEPGSLVLAVVGLGLAGIARRYAAGRRI
jgi:hypothetical protein